MYSGGHFDVLFFDVKTSNSSLTETDSIGDDRKSIVATIDVRTFSQISVQDEKTTTDVGVLQFFFRSKIMFFL